MTGWGPEPTSPWPRWGWSEPDWRCCWWRGSGWSPGRRRPDSGLLVSRQVLDPAQREDLRRGGEEQPRGGQAARFPVGMAQAGELRRTQGIGLEQFDRVARRIPLPPAPAVAAHGPQGRLHDVPRGQAFLQEVGGIAARFIVAESRPAEMDGELDEGVALRYLTAGTERDAHQQFGHQGGFTRF